MKKLITIFVVCLSIMLAGASVANASFSKVFTDGTLNVPAGISGLSPYSSSSAYVVEWPSGISASDGDWGNTTNTDALANIGSASQYSWTTDRYAASDGVAAPPQFVESEAHGYAGQQWTFTATAAGPETFILDYTISQDMDTDVLGEWADSYNYVDLYVYNTTTGQSWNSWTGLYKLIQDGASYSWLDDGSLSVKGNFGAGDTGYVDFEVYSEAEAYTIIPAPVPAPGAILLGGIGVSLVGWMKRRRVL